MNRWEWTYAVLNIMKLVLALCFYAHWQACAWGLISSYFVSDGTPNWISDFDENFKDRHGRDASPSDQ